MTSTDHTAAAARRAAAQDQERSELRSALQEERRGYVARGLSKRVKAVDAQLEALGDEPADGDRRAQPEPTPDQTQTPSGNPPIKATEKTTAAPQPAAQTPTAPPQAPEQSGSQQPAPEAKPAEQQPQQPATPARRGGKATGA
jgi:outer membrane biosynthesis protein TonB